MSLSLKMSTTTNGVARLMILLLTTMNLLYITNAQNEGKDFVKAISFVKNKKFNLETIKVMRKVGYLNLEFLENEYLASIAIIGAVPLCIAILGIFAAPLWCVLRGCKGCCNKKPKTKLNFWEVWTCYFILIPVGITIAVVTPFGTQANRDIGDGLIQDADESLYKELEYLLDDALYYYNNISDTLFAINSSLSEADTNLDKFVDFSTIRTTLDLSQDFDTSLLNFSHVWHNSTVTTLVGNETNINLRTSETFSCHFCQNISTKIEYIDDQVSENSRVFFKNTVDDVAKPIIRVDNSKTSIQEKLGDVLHRVQSDLDVMNDVYDLLYVSETVLEPVLEDTDAARESYYNSAFAVCSGPLLLVLLGGLCKAYVWFHMAYCISWLGCVLMLLLAAFHLPFAVFVYDACDLVYEVTPLEIVTQLDKSIADGFKPCFANESIQTVPQNFKLDDQFELIRTIHFDKLNDVDARHSFNFPRFTLFSNEAYNLTNETYLHGTNYTQESITDYMDSNFTSALNLMKANMYAINIVRDDLEAAAVDMFQQIERAASEFESIEEKIVSFDALDCDFMQNVYQDLVNVSCGDKFFGGLSTLAMATSILSIATLIFCVGSMILSFTMYWNEFYDIAGAKLYIEADQELTPML